MRLLERELIKAGRVEPLSYYHLHWTRANAPLLDDLGAVIDHVEAHSAGGPTTEDNLVTACNKCNGRKSSARIAEWDKRPKHKPIRGKYGETGELGRIIDGVCCSGAGRSGWTDGERERLA